MTDEIWYYWLDGTHSPPLNMALDEALLKHAAGSGHCMLRCYGWDRPSISIGYLQAYDDCARPGFEIVRRPTGGGVVFHDHDFTYTVVIPAGHWLTDVDRVASYGHVNRAVMSGLRTCGAASAELTDTEISGHVARRSMVCFEHPTRYDIVADKRKVAGSAQRRVREGILHQGSIHFGGTLPFAADALARAMVEGFREELGVDMREFKLPPRLLGDAEAIADAKYRRREWNRKR